MMNHPYPANLPLLRKMYNDRFSVVRFLIPFERMPEDEDVITVYRGSYNHAGYLTDAQHALKDLDCDYFLIIHDDVLLNPKISEANFTKLFPLGEKEAFIPRVGALPESIGDWSWYFGFIAKLLFPKSILFGAGVEPGNLTKYLPSASHLQEAMVAAGLSPTVRVRLADDQLGDISTDPSRVLLHGFATALEANAPEQSAVDQESLAIEQRLIRLMLSAMKLSPYRQSADLGDTAELPLPVLASGYMTDFYVLPKSSLADFCHYIGVASAAGLFVEIMAPTLLFACCDRVRTGRDFALDFSGFDEQKSMNWFSDSRSVAIHPFKLSAFKSEESQQALMEVFRCVVADEPIDPGLLARTGFKTPLTVNVEGWHAGESWGAWSARQDAMIQLPMNAAAPVRVTLVAPLHPAIDRMTGSLKFGGSREIGFAAIAPNPDVVINIERLEPEADGIARVWLHSDTLVEPAKLEAGSRDTRALGFGLVAIEAMAELEQPTSEPLGAEG